MNEARPEIQNAPCRYVGLPSEKCVVKHFFEILRDLLKNGASLGDERLALRRRSSAAERLAVPRLVVRFAECTFILKLKGARRQFRESCNLSTTLDVDA